MFGFLNKLIKKITPKVNIGDIYISKPSGRWEIERVDYWVVLNVSGNGLTIHCSDVICYGKKGGVKKKSPARAPSCHAYFNVFEFVSKYTKVNPDELELKY
jgi:hypothetical protein